MAEQWSCSSPGTIASLVRVPPPISSAASSTVTSTPGRARVTAAASPLGPPPTTIAVLMPLRRTGGARVRRLAGRRARSRRVGIGPLGSHGCSATASATFQVPRSITPRAASMTL